MIKHFFFIIFTIVSFSVFAQTVTVLDKTTLDPLSHVEIFSMVPPLSALTNNEGRADISAFSAADSIYFNTVGYQKVSFGFEQLKKMDFTVYLSAMIYDLNAVVISASRFEEKIVDVPNQIQVITARQLEFMNAETAADVMMQSGNVLVQKSQLGGGSPQIRGFEANKVLLVVDGVRMNNAIYRAGHLQNIITMDNTMLEKTEIVFGPGSVMYGSDALGGVVHFYTRKPRLSDLEGKTLVKAGAFIRYSTAYDENTGHVNFNIGGKKFASLTAFSYSKFGDLRQGNVRNPFYGDTWKRFYYADRIEGKDTMLVNKDYNIQKESGYKQYDLLQKFLFKQNEKVSHGINIQYSTSSDIPRYDRLTDFSGDKLKYAQWYYGPQQRLLADYNLNLSSAKGFYDQARIILSFQDIEESRHNRRFGKNELGHRTENVKVYALNADLSKTIKDNEIRYGIEAVYNDVQSTAEAEDIVTGAISPLDTRYPGGGSTMNTYAAYLMHTWEISPQLILADGLRYNYVTLNSKFTGITFFPFPFNEVTQKSGALNGKLGLIVMPGCNWRFSILGATGFRAPNVDDISKVFESVPGDVIVPNSDLKPEYTYNGELNISKVIDNKIRIEGIGYYTIFDNVITIEPTIFNGQDSIMYDGLLSRVTTPVNKKKAYIYGFSGNFSAEITEAFSITSTLNYTFGRFKTDTMDVPLDHISPLFGKTSLNLAFKKFRSEFYLLYNGWKRLSEYSPSGEDNHNYATPLGMPAWITLNLKTAYYVNENLQIQVALENILDRNYRVFASGISAPGRNLILTLRGRF